MAIRTPHTSTGRGSRTASRKSARNASVRTGSRASVGRSASTRNAAPRQGQSLCIDWARVRLGFVGVMFGLAWLALWGRAYYVQVVDGPRLAQLAQGQHLASEFVSGERGKIFDRQGRLLARSVEFTSVYAKPLQVQDASDAAQVLARVLGEDVAEMHAKLTEPANYVWIARQIGDRAAADIEAAQIPGVFLTHEYTRQYPCKELAGKLIGFVGVDENGLEGLEASFDDYLAGASEELTVQRDASGQRLYIDPVSGELVDAGQDLWLTLDAHIQFVAEQALEKAVNENQARWGASLVVSVETGEVLAWAEYPFFNPNAYRQYEPGQWRNRIAMDALEPGSDMKPFIVAAALQEGVCEWDTLYFCENGSWRVKGKDINDIGSHDWLPVNRIVQKSSNIGAAKLAMDLGAQTLHDYLSRLGFGRRTGMPLTGESPGILHPAGAWNEFDIAAAGFGQGYAVTALQLTQAYMCLANMGETRDLRIVSTGYDHIQQGERIFSPDVAREVLAMMEDVVSEEGTGSRAMIDGLSIAGKTSTAQKADPEGGYSNRYVASFVGMAPARDPKLMVVVIVDEPTVQYYGGLVAAPAFREIMLGTLAYLGGLPDSPQPEADIELVDASQGDFAELEQLAAEAAQEQANGEESIVTSDAPLEHIIEGETSPVLGVPDVRGMSVRAAFEVMAGQGVVPVVQGQGAMVVRQEPAPGSNWPEDARGQCVLWLGNGTDSSS